MRRTITVEIEIPQAIKVSLDGHLLVVSGPKGALKRAMFDPSVSVKVDAAKVVFSSANATKREKRKIGTFSAHLRNMFRGVTQGHIYKLKICASHFPMTVAVEKAGLLVKNFLGEKVPRKLKLVDNVSVKVDGDIIEVTSIDKDAASQIAASIEQLTRITRVDRRVFQDGCYIIEKDGKVIK